MGHALFIAESFGGWDGDGVAGRQQAGEECAESEERGGCEQTACGKGALHPVGEDGAEKAVKGKTDDNARGRADERDARGDPQDVCAGCAEREADTAPWAHSVKFASFGRDWPSGRTRLWRIQLSSLPLVAHAQAILLFGIGEYGLERCGLL